MNAVEIEEAVSELAAQPFDAGEFPFAFLAAFGNKDTTLRRLRQGTSNKSDLGGVLQQNHIHLKVCGEGEVTATLNALRQSPATVATRNRVKFILATDGARLEAENVANGDVVACAYTGLADHFGFFLPLAGITTVQIISENAFDIRATSKLNRLYIELLKDNPDWAAPERRGELNHFMARLIFCFFAEDTSIFHGEKLFSKTIVQMSDATNTHAVMSELFRAMNTPQAERESAAVKSYADMFPYVNGGLFSGTVDVPRFNRSARAYLLAAAALDWTKINPDIFGSMIQAVADDEERGNLGMHYTSVPNILKVLNPLFLDDLRAKLDEAGDNPRKLLHLRQRIARIRVFDPACGSGNFLVIAYKEMRAIEAVINQRRGEADRSSDIPATNFRGIEIRHFSCEIARLALIIAEFQCDKEYRGLNLALAEFLPLANNNWITHGNALQLDWLDLCPPAGTGVKLTADDLFTTPLDQTEIDFENEGGETYICGNPPYRGSSLQTSGQKNDLKAVFDSRVKNWKILDYVAGWFLKAADYASHANAATAFVATNSICQGQHVPVLWPLLFRDGHEITFAHTSFKWANLASHNAGVTVVIVGFSKNLPKERRLFSIADDGAPLVKNVDYINAYLVAAENVVVDKVSKPLNNMEEMTYGNKPVGSQHLLLSMCEVTELGLTSEQRKRFIRLILGSEEFINGKMRFCLWIENQHLDEALSIATLCKRIEGVHATRLASRDKSANEMAARAHQMREMKCAENHTIVISRHSSENRDFLPVNLYDKSFIVADSNFALYDAPIWNLALIASRLHLVWIATVCGKLETRYRYSNTLGWNTFPVPLLTEQNKADLTSCAEDILLAREAHFPATLAELYEPGKMPANLREAHAHNDETLERIFIGRRFKNDTERLEKLFQLYTKMMVAKKVPEKTMKRTRGGR